MRFWGPEVGKNTGEQLTLRADDGYSGPEVCRVVGITYRQLDYWARTDLVRPSLADARGSGTQRRYSYRDLVRLKVVKSLLDAGVKLQTAREPRSTTCATTSASASGRPRASCSTAATRCSPATATQLVDLVRKGQGVLNIVPLGSMLSEVDAAIHELAPQEPATGAARGRRAAQGG